MMIAIVDIDIDQLETITMIVWYTDIQNLESESDRN